MSGVKKANASTRLGDWMGRIPGTGHGDIARGVRIEVRMVVKDFGDWTYVDEVLDKCREYGAAEIVQVIGEDDV